MAKFRVDVENVPEEVEAENREEAMKIAQSEVEVIEVKEE